MSNTQSDHQVCLCDPPLYENKIVTRSVSASVQTYEQRSTVLKHEIPRQGYQWPLPGTDAVHKISETARFCTVSLQE